MGQATIINNVETFANIPTLLEMAGNGLLLWVLKRAKVQKFCLAGKIKNTGLIEVPMGQR